MSNVNQVHFNSFHLDVSKYTFLNQTLEHILSSPPHYSLVFSPILLNTNHSLPTKAISCFSLSSTSHIFVRFDGGSSLDRSLPRESKSALVMSVSPCRLENSGPLCSSLSSWESEGVLLRLPKSHDK